MTTSAEPARHIPEPCCAECGDRRQSGAEVARLVREAADGSQAAWNELVSRFTSLVWAVCRAHRLSQADAADVHQVVWLRLVENLGRVRQPERLAGWLATVARHECLRVLARDDREAPDPVQPFLAQQPAHGDVELLRAERDEALWRALQQLSPKCRSLLRVLVADDRPSYEDVAAALCMPVGSIGPTRQRCLERLRDVVALAGITDAS
jgi:RNA polymerase sigma factor (sigma-70 family)